MKIEFEADQDVLKEALKKWGVDMQVIVAIEEMSELTKELSKRLRRGATSADWNNDLIGEEIADVQIMLWQLSEVVGRHTVQKHIRQKMERLSDRVNDIPMF